NASRSASECASEWLWTSPRDEFESYWYSEVDCQSAAPVLAKQGANGDTPVIANGRVPKANYSVNFTPRRYFDALGRSTKFTPFKHRPLFVDKPIVKKNELPFFTNEDKFTYGDDYMNFSGVLKKEGGGDDVICKNGDVCAEGVTCVAGSTGDMAKMIPVDLKNGANQLLNVPDKWSCYNGKTSQLGKSFVCGVEYYDYGVIEKDGTVVGGMTCTNINYSLYKPDEHGVADTNKVDYMLSGKSGYFPRSEKGKDECAVYDKDGKVIHRNVTTSLILAVKTNVRIAYNNPHWVKENFKIFDKKGDYKFSVNKDKSDSIMRHEKNGHVPLYECLLKYGVLDTIHVILKDICEKDYEYDIESQYIVLYNEKDVEQLKDSVKSSKVASHLKKRIDAYMNATAEWFHNDARKKECDGLSSILKEECKNPKYDHFDGPYSPIECPDVKEIEKYVPSNLIPRKGG
ncbi:MAG: hypothetical protein MJZ76_11195, partial [Bacteroidales bacterium]|nr:hypothetical protein [Bacteroidales bacterium]